MSTTAQESRKETVSAAVTATEKWQIQLVKRRTGEDVSELMRRHSLSELIEMGRRIDEALGEIAPSDLSSANDKAVA